VNGTTFAALLGGIGLFLLGMRMMTDGLKLAAGNALKTILYSWTKTNLRGFLAGVLITAVVQLSGAVTVATVGFVNAGLLTLGQAVWVVFGTNIGTTMTAWLVALIGVRMDMGALALPLLGAGMLLRLAAGSNVRRAGFGEAAAGFGAFFLGIGVLQGAFADLAPRIAEWPLESPGVAAVAAFVGLGVLLTVLTQSSSAAIAITLTASAGGALPLELAAAAVVGTNVGTTSTALFASFGATPPAKRVASAHIAFNLLTGAVALGVLPLLLVASNVLVDLANASGETATVLAAFHTLFNVLGVLLMVPISSRLVRFLSRRFVSTDEEIGRPVHLDSTLVEVPALALRGLVLELGRMSELAFELAGRRIRGVAVEPEGRQRQEGLVRLGQAIRAFVGELSTRPLPEDVVAALPDLLRSSQHLEDVAAESALLGRPRREPPMAAAARADHPAADWQALIDAVTAGIAQDGAVDGAEIAERVGRAYEALKAELLRAGAGGRLRVDAMEEELLRARRLRRVADSALKARRRLAPWVERSNGGGEAAEDAARTSPTRPAPEEAVSRSGSG
jgi:phosphate:Na+ symporter